MNIKMRGLILTTLGIPVLSGVIIAVPVLIARCWGTALLDRGFWLGSAVFFGVSLIALILVLRASARVRRTGEAGASAAVARWSPLLMVLGGAAGALVGWQIAESGLKTRWQSHASDCALVADAAQMDACLPVMNQCDIDTRDTPGIEVRRDGQMSVDWPKGLRVPDDAVTRARVLCAWRALRGVQGP
jgi:hypothetical protein